MYVRIRSWHVVGTPTRVPDTYLTLCGRRARGTDELHQISADLPAEKSCEACLRIARRQGDDV